MAPERFPRPAEVPVHVGAGGSDHEDVERLGAEAADDGLHIREQAFGSRALESQQEIARHVRDADRAQIAEAALDHLEALPAPVVANVDLFLEGLYPERKSVEAV